MEVQSTCPSSFHNPSWVKWPMNSVDGCIMLFIEKEDKLIAYCFFEVESDDDITIHSVEVHPEYQRKGIGTQLVNRLFQLYPDFDFHILVTFNDKAQSFWKKHGFVMLYGFEMYCSSTPYLIRTKKNLSSLYQGDDPIIKQYLGATWSSLERSFIPIKNK